MYPIVQYRTHFQLYKIKHMIHCMDRIVHSFCLRNIKMYKKVSILIIGFYLFPNLVITVLIYSSCEFKIKRHFEFFVLSCSIDVKICSKSLILKRIMTAKLLNKKNFFFKLWNFEFFPIFPKQFF